MKNDFYRSIPVESIKSQYDTQCKRLLGNKTILSWILKYTIKDYSLLTLSQIEACIEGQPEISSVKVNPGETNAERITGSNTEDSIPEEGTILYDIRFFACLPLRDRRIKIIINVESQKDFHPGYSIVTRGIFYASRMISAQLDTEFHIPDYDSIKKVYSIWICMNAPKYIGNAITEYSIEKKDIVPGMPDKRREYDKISVITVCLNNETAPQTEMTDMLNVLLSPKMPKTEKVEILENKFNLSIENDMEKELNIMCNLSDYVEELGIKKGLEQGQNRVNSLNAKLAQAGRTADIIRASTDADYQQKLFEEFNI